MSDECLDSTLLNTTKLSNINPIDTSTKVRVWVDIINRLLYTGQINEYIFKTYSVKGQDTYSFGDVEGLQTNFTFPEGNYTVTYGGIVLQPDDYKLSGVNLIFVNGAPMESGYLITVRYEGMSNAVEI